MLTASSEAFDPTKTLAKEVAAARNVVKRMIYMSEEEEWRKSWDLYGM